MMISSPSRLRYGRGLVSSSRKFRSARVRASLPPFARTIGKSLSIIPPFDTRVDCYASTLYRVPEVWGEDAHVFNPWRYLNRQKKEGVPTVGVYGDVLTFGMFWLLDLLLLERSRASAPS